MSRRDKWMQQGHALRDAASAAWQKDSVKYGVAGAAVTLFALAVAGFAFRKPKAPVDVESVNRKRTARAVVADLTNEHDRKTLVAVTAQLVRHFEQEALRLQVESGRNAAEAEAYRQAHSRFSPEARTVDATTVDSTVSRRVQADALVVVSASTSPRQERSAHSSAAHSPVSRSALASPRAQQRVREQVLTTTGPASSPTIFGSDPAVAATRLRKHLAHHVEQQQQQQQQQAARSPSQRR